MFVCLLESKIDINMNHRSSKLEVYESGRNLGMPVSFLCRNKKTFFGKEMSYLLGSELTAMLVLGWRSTEPPFSVGFDSLKTSNTK